MWYPRSKNPWACSICPKVNFKKSIKTCKWYGCICKWCFWIRIFHVTILSCSLWFFLENIYFKFSRADLAEQISSAFVNKYLKLIFQRVSNSTHKDKMYYLYNYCNPERPIFAAKKHLNLAFGTQTFFRLIARRVAWSHFVIISRFGCSK